MAVQHRHGHEMHVGKCVARIVQAAELAGRSKRRDL